MSYDIVLQGGRVIDPANGIDGIYDVAVQKSSIAAVEKHLDAAGATTYDVTGCIVCPGVTDFHTHIYWGGDWGIDADKIGPKTGVTSFLDCGTAGAGNFLGFYEHIIQKSSVRIFSLLHIAYNGLFGAIFRPESFRIIGELEDIRVALIDKAVETAERYPDVIKGIKVRASVETIGGNGLQAVRLGKKAASMIDKPVMVHVGPPPLSIEDILDQLGPGDILTHSFRGPQNCLIDTHGTVIPQAIAARERGVLFDIGHGKSSFHFDTAKKLLDQGFFPDIISSDLHAYSITGPVFDMPTTMSKFLLLGMDLPDIIKTVTVNPMTVLGEAGSLGSLGEGYTADIAVYRIESGTYTYHDSRNNELIGDRRFVPVITFKDGKLLFQDT